MKVILALFSVAILAGCRGEPHSFSTFTKKKPLETDLVGTYAPTAQTLAYVKQKAKYPDAKISIFLSKDGTFIIENIPDCWNGEAKGNFDSGRGRWSLIEDSNHGWYKVGLNFSSTEGFSSEKGGGHLATSIRLVREGPPYLLHAIVGDPDSDEALQFEKVIEPN